MIRKRKTLCLLLLILSALFINACGTVNVNINQDKNIQTLGSDEESKSDGLGDISYSYEVYPLERNGIDLHLDCLKEDGNEPDRNILLIHGVTYSSHEFDVDYKDYSLVRKLAREGYAVWRLDIAGFGRSEAVEDGFMPDSDYAAEDINAAVEEIARITEQDKIDILGWSWGTVTVGRFAGKYGEHINRIVYRL